jgi:hypothetical protein
MEPKMKETLKMIGVILGIGAVISAVAYLLYKLTTTTTQEQNPIIPEQQPEQPLPSKGYTATEVKQMQSWLYSEGVKSKNQLISDSIMKTGGIDGVMGKGFNKALAEAIRVGMVDNLSHLHELAVH